MLEPYAVPVFGGWIKPAALVAGIAALLYLLIDFQNFIDLRVYRAGGQAWLDGFPLYTDAFGLRSGGLQFTYPPVSALLFTGFAVIPETAAVVLITTVSLAALATIGGMLVGWRVTAVLAVVLFAVSLEPVRQTISFGQINLLLMVLVVADCLLPRTWWPRGVLIGIAAALKLTPAVFILYFLAHRQWRQALMVVAGFAGATLLAWVLAPDLLPAYLQTVIGDNGRVGGLTYTGNQSINGLVQRLGLPRLVWFAAAAVVALVAGRAVRRLRLAGDDLGAVVVVATAGLLASPVSWSHHWVWAVVAGVWLWPRLTTWPARVTAGAAYVVFVAPPHWLLPHKSNRELDWAWWQHLVGNDFLWFAIALLIFLAFRKTTQQAGTPVAPPT